MFAVGRVSLNIAKIAILSHIALYWRMIKNIDIVVLKCQKCNECLNVHKSLCSLRMLSNCLCLFWSGPVSSSLWNKYRACLQIPHIVHRSQRLHWKDGKIFYSVVGISHGLWLGWARFRIHLKCTFTYQPRWYHHIIISGGIIISSYQVVSSCHHIRWYHHIR